uniref:Uncharacterized protein n=1 Tax=Globodera rostochiensis TaxID=31243 RepID=A0A914GS18_GLORO
MGPGFPLFSVPLKIPLGQRVLFSRESFSPTELYQKLKLSLPQFCVMIREWILLNATHMEARLHMATVHPNCGKSPRCATYHMLLHTQIVYKRVYPL